MKILIAASTIRDAQNIVRMTRPEAVSVDGVGRAWKAGADWFLVAAIGEKIARTSGYDRALVIGSDKRAMAWVSQVVTPAMGGVGTEVTVI